MKRKQSSIDGFIPRTRASVGQSGRPLGVARPEMDVAKPRSGKSAHQHAGSARVLWSDIDESLKNIDDVDNSEQQPKKGWLSRRRHRANQRPGRRKWLKRAAIALGIIGVLLAGYVGFKILIAGGNIFGGNPFDLFVSQPLKEDKNGRSNILIFGTSGTNEDNSHPGAELTDSIMVLSVNQKKKDAYMVSIPRDLYVDYGEACLEGYQGKINSLYECHSDSGKNEEAGAKALGKKVGEVLGLDIQYYAHVNWEVLIEAVDAVGGIDVKIETDDPRGILDRNFDWQCNYSCYFVKYKNGEVAHLDGKHALALARARNAQGGYGLAGGNFDREQNQQKVIKALRDKAASAGTLTNVGKVTGLIDALGNNLVTNFETKEVRTVLSLTGDISGDKLQSISLVKEGEAVVTTGNIGGASIVQPVAGLYDYSGIQAYINKQINASAITKEAAKIVVLNGSETEGLAQKEADALEDRGFTIVSVGNAAKIYQKATLYHIGDGKTATRDKLKQIYGISSVTTSPPPVPIASDTNFVLVVTGSSQR